MVKQKILISVDANLFRITDSIFFITKQLCFVDDIANCHVVFMPRSVFLSLRVLPKMPMLTSQRKFKSTRIDVELIVNTANVIVRT